MRKYEPVLLDRYPPKNLPGEATRRGSFPDYVPMFACPDDIRIVSADERPRSTWHGYAMTAGNGSRLHGVCITIWLPLNEQASRDIEAKCAAWRQLNMTSEERELASSLGERLATERVKLSKLLSNLSSLPSDSAERMAAEDQISIVEERITLMSDLLRPVRHGAASRIDGLTNSDSGLWHPRVYGVMGRDASLAALWKEWLRAIAVPMSNGALLRIPISSPSVGFWQPMERYVVNLCMEAPCPVSSQTQVELSIRDLRLYARKEANNEIPGSRNVRSNMLWQG